MKNLVRQIRGYSPHKPIGRGARSTIWEVERESDGHIFASKCIKVRNEEDKKALRHLENEDSVLKDLHSTEHVPPQIVKRYKFIRVRRFFRLKGACLMLNRVPGPDLEKDSDYPIDQKITIMEQTCRALEYVHMKGYIHGDLKPDNILVDDDGNVTLIDFGFAAPIGTDVDGMKGTRGFMAPEQNGGSLQPGTDIYNLGATMYRLFTGESLPYVIPSGPGRAGDGMAGKIDPKPPHHINTDIPTELSKLILNCCDPDGTGRPPLRKVKNRLHDIALQVQLVE